MDAVQLLARDILAKLSCPQRSPSEVASEHSLRYELGLDSLRMIELLMTLEKAFGITISDDDILEQEEWLATVGSLEQFISQHLPSYGLA